MRRNSNTHFSTKLTMNNLSSSSHCQLFLFLIFSLFLKTIDSHTEKAPSLLVIAFHGFRWDYLQHAQTHSENTRHFDQFIKAGVHARLGLKPVFPSLSRPNLWTLVTGLYPESHGIVDNDLYDPTLALKLTKITLEELKNPPKKKPLKLNKTEDAVLSLSSRFGYFDAGGEPIWVTNQLHSNKAKSGVVNWPGGDYYVKGSRSTFYSPYNKKADNVTKVVDNVIQWFTQKYPINLGLVYFDNPGVVVSSRSESNEAITKTSNDDAMETDAQKFVEEADRILGYVVSSLKRADLLDDVNVIVTSDHGATSVYKQKAIPLYDVIPRDSFTHMNGNNSPLLAIFPKTGMRDKLYAILRSASVKKGGSHFSVWKKDSLPERYHYQNNTRIAPIIALANLHYYFSYQDGKLTTAATTTTPSTSTSGYDNQLPQMRPLFLAQGPSFRKGFAVSTFDMVDVYPLMCQLLDVHPAPNNGSLRVVSKLLSAHETTNWTFATYIFVLIFCCCFAGLFVVGACRQHRYLKRKLKNWQNFKGGIRYSVPSKGNAVVRLLSDNEDEDDNDENEKFDDFEDSDDKDENVIMKRITR